MKGKQMTPRDIVSLLVLLLMGQMAFAQNFTHDQSQYKYTFSENQGDSPNSHQNFRRPIWVGTQKLKNAKKNEFIKLEVHDLGSVETREDPTIPKDLYYYINFQHCTTAPSGKEQNCEEIAQMCRENLIKYRCFINYSRFQFIKEAIKTGLKFKKELNLLQASSYALIFMRTFATARLWSQSIFRTQNFWTNWIVPLVGNGLAESLAFSLTQLSREKLIKLLQVFSLFEDGGANLGGSKIFHGFNKQISFDQVKAILELFSSEPFFEMDSVEIGFTHSHSDYNHSILLKNKNELYSQFITAASELL